MVLRICLRFAAAAVASCFVFLSVFEASLALEVPIAGKSYSEVSSDRDMVVMLRSASVVASILWIFATIIFVHHSGLLDCGLSSDISTLTAWGITAGWSVCSVLYVTPTDSEDGWPLFHPFPATILLAIACMLITYYGNPEEKEIESENESTSTQVSIAEREEERSEPLLKAHIAVQVV